MEVMVAQPGHHGSPAGLDDRFCRLGSDPRADLSDHPLTDPDPNAGGAAEIGAEDDQVVPGSPGCLGGDPHSPSIPSPWVG
jgi:hypothetical protein